MRKNRLSSIQANTFREIEKKQTLIQSIPIPAIVSISFTILMFAFCFILITSCERTDTKKLNSGEVAIKWVDNLDGDFSFKNIWSYPEDEEDTTHLFHSIKSEAWTYEWGGTDFITAERINKDSVVCFTENNAATHSSLNLVITKNTVKPTIVLNSIADINTIIYNCKSGEMSIDKNRWKEGILKATFDFDFYHTEDSTKMYWKGDIYAKIEKYE